jgi:tetratricopeptide (TPR) repeat protein
MNDDTFRRVVLSAIILAGILLYSSTLSYPQFLFDGNMFLLNNPLFKDLNYYAQLFDIRDFSRLDEQLGLNPDVTTNFMMRPVAYLTFSINYMISGFDPAAFRAVNIAIHILNSLLVFACIELFLCLAPSCRKLSRYSARFIPTTSAFIFLLHPMQTESVTYITQRFTSLAALFYLATIWLYLVWSWQKKRGISRGYVRWLSVAVLLLGMLTRESLFTAPFMIVLLEVTVLGNGLKAGIRQAAPHLMLLPIIPLMVIMVSAAQNNSSPTFYGTINVVNYVDIPIAHYALTQMVVVITYLRLYLLPYGQNLDPAPPLYTSPYQLPVLGASLIFFFLLGGSYYLYRRNRDDVRCVLVLVGICWYFLALAVSSSFIPLPDLMAEHRAYLPSVGFIMALICLIDFLRTMLGTARFNGLFVAGISVWCIILIVLTNNRNNVWQSGIHLWSDTVMKSPAKDRPWHNLGIAYFAIGNYSEAQKCFLKVIEINPDWGNAYVVLAVTYLELKRYQDAVGVSLRGIDVDPANPVNYNNLGIAYAELDREEDAKQAFSTAIALRPGYENAKINLDRLESFIETEVVRRR